MANIVPPSTRAFERVPTFSIEEINWRKYALVLLFCLAALIRIKDIRAPGELVEREYTSAIFARTYYYEANPGIEPWRREQARSIMEDQPVLEPPLTEYLVSLLYRLIGREELWYSRFITYGFWFIGGVFFFLLTKRLLSSAHALAATAYYLLAPSGILTSRSFQPDALMMAMFLLSLYCIIRYFDRLSIKMLVLTATISGLTLLLRPLVLFPLFAVFVSLSVFQKRNWKVFLDRDFILFFLISSILPAVYYGYGIFIAGYMRWKVTTSFLPYLFTREEYWKGWFELAVNQAGLSALIAAIAGFWLLKKEQCKAVVLGLVIGYLCFGLVFNYHISTHGYYHLQLLPLVGICLGPTVALLINSLKESAARLWWLPVSAVLLIFVVSGYFQVKNFTRDLIFEAPYTAREIGELVKHSSKTVFLAYHYGLPLEYYGELTGKYWLRSASYWLVRPPGLQDLTVQERLNNLGFIPEYFIISHFSEYYSHHQDLKAYLENNCSLLTQTNRYLIYNACRH